MRPATGCLKIPVVTVVRRHRTFRGRPTCNETSFTTAPLFLLSQALPSTQRTIRSRRSWRQAPRCALPRLYWRWPVLTFKLIYWRL